MKDWRWILALLWVPISLPFFIATFYAAYAFPGMLFSYYGLLFLAICAVLIAAIVAGLRNKDTTLSNVLVILPIVPVVLMADFIKEFIVALV